MQENFIASTLNVVNRFTLTVFNPQTINNGSVGGKQTLAIFFMSSFFNPLSPRLVWVRNDGVPKEDRSEGLRNKIV